MLLVALLALFACDASVEPDSGGKAGDTGAVDSGEAQDTDTADTAPADTADTADSGDSADTAPVPVDADGDGFFDAESGGDDCDDANAYVHPGATEYCDAVDQDCDGEPLAPGACGLTVDPAAGVQWIFETAPDEGGEFAMAGDLSGDGKDDVVFVQHPRDFVAVVAGGTFPEAPTLVPDEAWHVVHDDRGSVFSLGDAIDVGDVDGDGNADLGILGTVEISLHFGPLPWGDSGLEADADAVWEGYTDDAEVWPGGMLTGHDFDGDGRDDALVGENASPGNPSFDAFFGGDWEARCAFGSFGTMEVFDALDDVDGDGLPDVLAGGYVLSGADLRGSCGAEESDLALATVDVSGIGGASNWASVGDVTGDGAGDFVASASSSDTAFTKAGEILFYSGSARGDLTADDAIGSYVGSKERDYMQALGSSDFDGDGARELFVSEDKSDIVSVVRLGNTPPPGTELPERRLKIEGPSGPPEAYPSGEVGDFDGDARDDLFVRRAQPTNQEPTRVGVLRGFPVPWDDDGAW